MQSTGAFVVFVFLSKEIWNSGASLLVSCRWIFCEVSVACSTAEISGASNRGCAVLFDTIKPAGTLKMQMWAHKGLCGNKDLYVNTSTCIHKQCWSRHQPQLVERSKGIRTGEPVIVLIVVGSADQKKKADNAAPSSCLTTHSFTPTQIKLNLNSLNDYNEATSWTQPL